jgi:hypothetical protein
MKHWVVKVDTKTYVVEAETAEQADREAVMRWFHESYISIKSAQQIFCPCQWGEECPEGMESCGECFKKMKGE